MWQFGHSTKHDVTTTT